MKDLSSFKDLAKLKTLWIRSPLSKVDLSLLPELKSVESFFVDNDKRTKLETIPYPIQQIKYIVIQNELNQATQQLIKEKFPNAEIKQFKHPDYK